MNILFIDGDPNVLRGLVRSVQLEDENWQAAVAFDADRAFSLMKRYAFDAVITDWPNTAPDGGDILDHFADKYPDCACVVLASNLSHSQKFNIQNKSVPVLTKPTPWDRIRETVQKAVAARGNQVASRQTQKETLPANHLQEILKPRRKPAILNRIQKETL